ncbi:MAG: hypothetical protein ACI4GV_04110 [Acutalibacteraceae bacterium]
MTAEFEIFRKDLIKLNIYKEVVADKTVLLDFFLDGNSVGTNYFDDIHDENIVMNRYGCFNISEDKNSGCITIRPALIKFELKISIICRQPFSEQKTLTVYRDGKTDAETSFDITNNCESVELIPENDKYIMKINYIDGTSNTENTADAQQAETPVQTENTRESTAQNTVQSVTETNTPAISANENKADSQNKNTGEIPQQKLDAIKAESEKDYEQYAEKLKTVREEYEFDKSVIEYYKDHDLVPIEKIFAEIDEKLKSAEEQIKLFVEARQNKTKEIEE